MRKINFLVNSKHHLLLQKDCLQCTNISGILSSAFLQFSCKFSKKVIFHLPVNTDKLKFVAFLVFVCTTASFIAQISSSENSSKRDAILASVAIQPRIFRVTVANENARKLLFTDLVNTNEG